MRAVSSSNLTRSRSAVSTKIVAAAVVLIVLVAGVAGYFLLLRPGTTTSSQVSSSSCTSGSSVSCPVSAVTLYNVYGLGGIPTDYKQFTNHTIFASGNLTSVINYPAGQKQFGGNSVETGMFTNGNDFEYWYWQNSTGLPAEAGNQAVVANCLVRGLAPYGNGSSILYLENCNLISLRG